MMNAAQAKSLSLPQIMARLGYQPVEVKKNGLEYWYLSPFRMESEASFHTSYLGGKWIWNDFGDIGGTVIDFIMRHENQVKVKDALAFLDHLFQGHLFETPRSAWVGQGTPSLFSSQPLESPSSGPDTPTLTFLEAFPVRTALIYHYLQHERAIPNQLVDRYLLEVRYRNEEKGKEFFAFGMKNETGGYEIRAASSQYAFKSALMGRDISLIGGRQSPSQTVSLFEGMTDFLSLLVLLQTDQLKGDAIIMHSLSSFDLAANAIQREGYELIHGFLDNDRVGQGATTRFQQCFPGKVKPQNHLYQAYKDLNEALLSGLVSIPVKVA